MSLTLEKFSKDGKSAGTIDVSEEVFGVEPNIHVLHQAARREMANARAGTANTKTRSEVRGGGRKPWKQKGTGRARAGSIRSPLWPGGGVIFGPQPRDYSITLPKKVRVLALRSSLSAAREKFRVVDDFSFLKAAKTKDVANFLASLGLTAGKKVVILADTRAKENQFLALSARNIPKVKVSLPLNLRVRDLLEAELIVATQQAVETINAQYAKKDKEKVPAKSKATQKAVAEKPAKKSEEGGAE